MTRAGKLHRVMGEIGMNDPVRETRSYQRTIIERNGSDK